MTSTLMYESNLNKALVSSIQPGQFKSGLLSPLYQTTKQVNPITKQSMQFKSGLLSHLYQTTKQVNPITKESMQCLNWSN